MSNSLPEVDLSRLGIDAPEDSRPAPKPLSEEDLNAPLPGRPLWADTGRKLTRADKLLIEVEGGEHAPGIVESPNHVARMTFRHHQAAKYLAAGVSVVEAAAMSGYSPSALRTLSDQPLFTELVEHYEKLEESRSAPVQDALTTLGLQVAHRLMDRVERTSEFMETKDLTAIMTTALDRAGFSPKQRTETVSVTMTGEELATLKATAASKRNRGVVIIQDSRQETDELDQRDCSSGGEGATDQEEPPPRTAAPRLEAQGQDL